MNRKVYDYAIVGAGAAGLQLVLSMMSDPWFADKKILILDKDNKDHDDHTFCFWEQGAGRWDNLISHQWERGVFETKNKKRILELNPYSYKMLRSINFYNHAKDEIAKTAQIDWFKENVLNIAKADCQSIETAGGSYEAKHLFDSRVETAHIKNKSKYTQLIQHFKGWEIETAEDCFDKEEFVMMDYRIKYKESTSFTYVLPFSSRKALIEFTFFNKELVPEKEYDQLLEQYISEVLKIKTYKVNKVEMGQIPMSDLPFHKASREGVTKIGTAGSWVKASSGYAFKYIERYVDLLIENIKNGRPPEHKLFSNKHRFYDRLFLDVLSKNNELGENVFEEMYMNNSIQDIFKFLDEKTSLKEDVKVISTLQRKPFLKALWRRLFKF